MGRQAGASEEVGAGRWVVQKEQEVGSVGAEGVGEERVFRKRVTLLESCHQRPSIFVTRRGPWQEESGTQSGGAAQGERLEDSPNPSASPGN